jgi:hypothetical protein
VWQGGATHQRLVEALSLLACLPAVLGVALLNFEKSTKIRDVLFSN